MKISIKKHLVLCIVLSMMLTLAIPFAAYAKEGQGDYDVCVGGIWITATNKDDVLGNGTVKYDPETETLTLNNAHIEGVCVVNANGGYKYRSGIYSDHSLTIFCIGNNYVEVPLHSENYVNELGLCIWGTLNLVKYGTASASLYTIQPHENSGNFNRYTAGNMELSIDTSKKYEDFPDLYEVTVGGTPITYENKDDVFGDGTVRYNGMTSTLTLSDYKATKMTSIDNSRVMAAFIYAKNNMHIVLKGDNVLDGEHAENLSIDTNAYGIYSKGKLSIDGTVYGDLLTIHYPNVKRNVIGIYAATELELNDNAEVDIYDNNLTLPGTRYGVLSSRVEMNGGVLYSTSTSNVFAAEPSFSKQYTYSHRDRDYSYDEIKTLPAVMVEPIFPDPVVYSYVMRAFDKNGDYGLSSMECSIVKTLDFGLKGENVHSLRGIRFFPNLETLICENSRLTSLALEKNLMLRTVKINMSNISEWYPKGENIETIECSGGIISTLVLNQTPNLKNLDCSDNLLTELDLSETLVGTDMDSVARVGYQYKRRVGRIEVTVKAADPVTMKKIVDERSVDDTGYTKINVIAPDLEILDGPRDTIAREGEKAVFNVKAKGYGLKYQWQWRKNSTETWANYGKASEDAFSFSIDAIKARDGFQYRVVITDGSGKLIESSAATLSVASKLKITKQPENQTASSGTVKFTIEASGDGLTYFWYWRKNSSDEWKEYGEGGETATSISIGAIEARNGFQYKCYVYDKYHSRSNPSCVVSDIVTFRYGNKITITKQPANVTAKNGTTAKIAVTATGDGLTYQWQWRKNASAAWGATDFTGCKTNTLSVPAITARNGFQYRCMVKDKYGSVVYTNAATLTVQTVAAITKQPTDVNQNSGTAKFSVTAVGDGLTYQWQWRKNASSTWGGVDFEGAKTNTVSVPAIAARNGFQYRCMVKDKYGNTVYSNAATLYVRTVAAITKQPVSVTQKTGTATFSITAVGDGITYQWYWRKNAASAWGVCGFTGSKTNAVKVEVIPARDGYQYRCEVRDQYGNVVYSNPATLNVGTKAAITKQPVSITAASGTIAKFTITATGDGLTYQWQWRKNSSAEWANYGKESATATSLSIEAIDARYGFQYHCIVKDKFGNTVTSSTAVLTLFE